MDSNGQPFWLWSRPGDWVTGAGCTIAARDAVHGGVDTVLALASERGAVPRLPGIVRAERAETELGGLPLLHDRFGTHGRWDPVGNLLTGFGAFPGEAPRYASAGAGAPLAMALDHDDRLLLAFAERIELVDLRGRHGPLRLELPAGFTPHALACDGQGGRWALDRVNRRLARIAGTPFPDRGDVVDDSGTFRPDPENSDDARIELLDAGLLDAFTRPVALAASAAGRLAVIAWGADGVLQLSVVDGGRLSARRMLDEAAYAHAVAWIDELQLALKVSDLAEVLVYAADGPSTAPLGQRWPCADAAPGGFVAGPDWPPRLPLVASADVPAASLDPGVRFSRPLVPLAWRGFAATGVALGRPVDTGTPDLVWHRLYLEAVIPPGCAVLVELAADDDAEALDDPATPPRWSPHGFGDASALAALDLPADTPRAAWCPQASELPHHGSLLGCAPQAGRVGLFGVLVQRAGMQLRDLRGRHLRLRLTLLGNGRASPLVAGLRAWGGRFSHVRRYLPELYRDDAVFDREATGRATRHDFLDRFAALFEGVLTPLEDRIADARVLTSPASAPDDALDWLARWTGERFPARLPRDRRRAWLQQAPALRTERGTLAGLRRALDVATGGAVAQGRIVIVEDHLLRRTLATLIGIDLGRADDPLLPGLIVSGNAFVGDTLVLGDADDPQVRREFLALFGDEIDNEAERLTVASVHDRTAHRATVLVHEGLDATLVDMVRSVADEVAPAHVALKVIAAREPFLEGIASLVGVDSYLRAPLPLQPVRIQRSRIGRGDRITGGGALDPRLDDSATLVGHDGVPRARLQGAAATPQPGQGGRILLDGTASDPPAGGAIARWRFTRLPT